MGPARRARRRAGGGRLSRRRRAGATSSTGLDRVTPQRIPTSRCSMPARASDGAHVVISGGRVLCVTALGDSVRQAQRARLRRGRRDPLRRHAVPHATSATARSSADHDGRTRRRRRSGARHRGDPRLSSSACRRASSRRSRRSDGAAFRRDDWAARRQAAAASSHVARGRPRVRARRRAASRTSRATRCRRRRPRTGRSSPGARGRRWACRWCSIRAIRMRRRCT